MLAQRAVQQSLRRMAGQQHVLRMASPAAIAMGSNTMHIQKRTATATTISEKDARDAILVQQRLNRPNSPHLSIYRPQITWIGSITTRITGSVLSGAFYVFGSLYLVAPYLGMNITTAAMASGFAAWPWVAKVASKSLFAWFFTYHSINGLRHLVWDTASMMTNKAVTQTGWAVVGLSVVSALALALM